jgi:hypothetical protein
MWVAPGLWRFIDVEPLDRVELFGIELHGSVAVPVEDVPEGYIGMACRKADCLGNGQHQWRVGRFFELELEFFRQLTHHRDSRMFARLYVPTGGQPELRLLVIHK